MRCGSIDSQQTEIQPPQFAIGWITDHQRGQGIVDLIPKDHNLNIGLQCRQPGGG